MWLNLALRVIASAILGISGAQWQRLVNYVTELEDEMLTSAEKHLRASRLLSEFVSESASEGVKRFVFDNTRTVLDGFVKLALAVARRYA